jgi:uridine phosphorylase
MNHKPFRAEHMNATSEDFLGNNGVGRYLLLPGSEHRARAISEHFENRIVKEHQRGHHLYLGTLPLGKTKIEVAAISTGMGCPSAEIIVHELFHLGAKRFLRVGTAGSLQSDLVEIGDLVSAQASVRDENTTSHYAPPEFPALASLQFTSAIITAGKKLGISDHLHTGIVHCKSTLYASEFGAGPRAVENKAYLELLGKYGVLATEMETATIFVQSQIYNQQIRMEGPAPQFRVLAGAVLAIVASPKDFFTHSDKADKAVEMAVELGLESVKTLASQELGI